MKENIKIIQNQIKQEKTKQNKTEQNKTKQDTTKQKKFINTRGNKIDKRESKWRKERRSFEEDEEDSDNCKILQNVS